MESTQELATRNGRTYYFVSEQTRREFKTQLGSSAT